MPDAKKILVVDDEPHILRSLGFVLQRAGYEVLEARGGAEALRLIAQERPDLIFLDIMLPELDGYEVCRRVKSDDELAATYVIMLTARGQLADREESLTAGADEYMTKPFSPSRAVARVQEALAQTR
ncbi:MAG: response regulator transcription factor [Planctomycetota bacterium]|jgi:two-component system alkaline phosphatase synthesis response regulator PhoP